MDNILLLLLEIPLYKYFSQMYLYKLLGKKEVVNGSFHILSCSRELNLTNLLIEPFIHNRCMLSSHFIAQITKPHDPYVSNFSKQSLLHRWKQDQDSL